MSCKAGDTLGAIAARLDADAADLAARNALANPDRLTLGQVLKGGQCADRCMAPDR